MLKLNGLYFWVYIVEWRCFFDNNEFQEYIKRSIQNFLDNTGKYQVDYDRISSIMDNEATRMIKGCMYTLAAKADELVSIIKNINFSILVSEKIKKYARIVKDTENLTEYTLQ